MTLENFRLTSHEEGMKTRLLRKLIFFILSPSQNYFPTNTISGGRSQPPELTFFQKALDCLVRHGALQAANVLNSAQINKMSVYIVRAFVRLRETALTNGVDQSGEEASFAFYYRAVTALTTTKSGIEQVPEGVTEHVEGVDDNG